MVRSVAITLLRHGLTDDNVKKRYLGWSDTPLSSLGKEQLFQLKKEKYPSPNFIISSDLMRCTETVAQLFDLNCTGPFVHSNHWRENHFGDWEKKTHLDLQDDLQYKDWLQSWEKAPIPAGEDFSTFSKRVMEGWQEAVNIIETESLTNLVIVSHAGPIRKILTEFAPNKRDFWDWEVRHGEGFMLETTRKRLRRNERCISLQAVPFKESENG